MKAFDIKNEMCDRRWEAECYMAAHVSPKREDVKRYNYNDWKPDVNEIRHQVSLKYNALINSLRNDVGEPPVPPKFKAADILTMGFGFLSRKAAYQTQEAQHEEKAQNLDKMVQLWGNQGNERLAEIKSEVAKETARLETRKQATQTWLKAEMDIENINSTLKLSDDLPGDVDIVQGNKTIYQALEETASKWQRKAIKVAAFDALSYAFNGPISEDGTEEDRMIHVHPVYKEIRAQMDKEIAEHPMIVAGDYKAYGHIHQIIRDSTNREHNPVNALLQDREGKNQMTVDACYSR